MTDLDRPLRSPALYNPHLLSREELLQLFQARQDLLDRLLDDLRSTPDGQPAQHHLIVGQRGMGKTMLLRRLQFAIEDDPQLREHWIPLTFPEEQYNVAHLSDFWLNCIDALSDRLERLPDAMPAIDLDRQVEALEDLPEAERASHALGVLLDAARTCERRFLLLVDNADLILERIDEQQWNLREVLSSQPLITFLGASAAVLETTYEYDKAFYDFFEIHQLSGLGPEETRDLLLNYARAQGVDEVRRIAEEEPGRLRTLHRLTGGNPRTLVLLFNILAQTSGGDIRTDLEQLLDHSTPLYKARFEALPSQAQQVVDALALHWDPVTAGDLTSGMRLEVNAVSSQLNRLVKAGLVEKVTYEPATRAGYQIAERFFNIWYLMRASRRVRRRLIWLVEFLRMFYGQEELANQARAHLRLAPRPTSGERLRHAEYSFALAQASESQPLREALERGGLRMLTGHQDLRKELRELIDLDAAEPDFCTRAEELEQFEALKRKLDQVLGPNAPADRRQLGKRFLRAALPLMQKGVVVSRLVELSPERSQALDDSLAVLERRITGGGDVGRVVLQAIEQGLMMSLDDVAGAEDAEAVLDVRGVVAIAAAARAESTREEALIDRLEKSLADATSAYPWLVWLTIKGASASSKEVDAAVTKISGLASNEPDPLVELGDVLWLELGRSEISSGRRLAEAEKAYRRALSLESTHVHGLNNLGSLLSKSECIEEAERLYMRALEAKPDDERVWYNLGKLKSQDGRSEEAEESYRRAVEVDPGYSRAWHNLGNLLHESGRGEEAEEAYRHALKADPRSAMTLNSLGSLLVARNRPSDAEEAYRSAIEEDPRHSSALYNLGWLLHGAARHAEAETYYRRAVEADPAESAAWNGLAVLIEEVGRREEAEQIYRRGLQANPGDAGLLNNLGNLLARTDQFGEAEAAFRLALDKGENRSLVIQNLALLLRRTGRSDEAEEALRQALAVEPQNVHLWFALGSLLEETDRNGAEEAYRRAVEVEPDDPTFLNAYAWLLFQSRSKLIEAERMAVVAATREQKDPHVHHTLACILIRNEKWTNAEESARIFLRAWADEPPEGLWTDVITFFREAVVAGKAREAATLLDEVALGDRWRPLREALESLARKNPKYLLRVAPEVREAAEVIVSQLEEKPD